MKRRPGRIQQIAKDGRPARFTADEFEMLLRFYGGYVSAGVWRDYAIDQTHLSRFSVFRHSFDQPLYTVSKTRRGRHCLYMVSLGGVVLWRGDALSLALAFISAKTGTTGRPSHLRLVRS